MMIGCAVAVAFTVCHVNAREANESRDPNFKRMNVCKVACANRTRTKRRNIQLAISQWCSVSLTRFRGRAKCCLRITEAAAQFSTSAYNCKPVTRCRTLDATYRRPFLYCVASHKLNTAAGSEVIAIGAPPQTIVQPCYAGPPPVQMQAHALVFIRHRPQPAHLQDSLPHAV